jgi:hypothetical protein
VVAAEAAVNQTLELMVLVALAEVVQAQQRHQELVLPELLTQAAVVAAVVRMAVMAVAEDQV